MKKIKIKETMFNILLVEICLVFIMIAYTIGFGWRPIHLLYIQLIPFGLGLVVFFMLKLLKAFHNLFEVEEDE